MGTSASPIPHTIRQTTNRFLAVLACIAVLASIASLPAAAQTESILYNFCSVQQNCGDGASPMGTLVRDSAGNLYGTTCIGGALEEGTVFKLSADGEETVLHSFEDSTGADGICPNAGITRDKNGNIYGTTTGGGVYQGGIVFKLSPSLTETILYTFGRVDARTPEGPLVLDRQGNLYGVTGNGGTAKFGAVYKIAPKRHRIHSPQLHQFEWRWRLSQWRTGLRYSRQPLRHHLIWRRLWLRHGLPPRPRWH